jgi:predicted porin
MIKNKWLIALSIMTLATGARAQSSVTLYGSIDEGLTYNTNAKGHGQALVGPVAVPDFFGLRGVEDLGGQLKAIFALQDGFVSNTGAGTIPGEAFSHFAWVGLAGNFGTFTLGRQLDLTTETLRLNSNGSVQYTFYMFHPANLDNIGIMGDSINNSLKYTTPNIGGFTATGLYGLDDTSSQPGHVFSADIVYKNGPLRASAVYSSWRNHAIDVGAKLGYTSFLGQSLSGGRVFTARNQEIAGLSAFYALNKSIDLHGMVTQVNLATSTAAARMRNTELGLDYHVTPANTVTFGGYLSWLQDTRYEEVGIGDLYSLSVRTTVYAQATYQHADGANNAAIPLLAPSGAPSQAAFRVGIHHFF